jgi:hypothetical protein
MQPAPFLTAADLDVVRVNNHCLHYSHYSPSPLGRAETGPQTLGTGDWGRVLALVPHRCHGPRWAGIRPGFPDADRARNGTLASGFESLLS